MHKQQSPFPMHTKYDDKPVIIIDEKCVCGRLRSAHADTSVAYGHGPSLDGKCRQFTWHDFVFQKEKRP